MQRSNLILAETTWWVRWTDWRGRCSDPNSTQEQADKFAAALREGGAKKVEVKREDRHALPPGVQGSGSRFVEPPWQHPNPAFNAGVRVASNG